MFLPRFLIPRHPLFVGLGGSFPLGEEELNARLKLAFFYPF